MESYFDGDFATAMYCKKEKMKKLILPKIDKKMSFHAKSVDFSNR